MKINYHNALHTLISFKAQFQFIRDSKNDRLLSYLEAIVLNYDADEIGVPDISVVCEAVKLPRNKVYPIIYKSYISLIESLAPHPATVSNCIHAIYIARHHEEESFRYKRGKQNKEELEAQERESALTFWGEFRLPVTPRLGEIISLDFIDWNIKYRRGVVTEIHHEISGAGQRIVLYVHPFRNYYWWWKRLERDENQRQSRERQWELERERSGI